MQENRVLLIVFFFVFTWGFACRPTTSPAPVSDAAQPIPLKIITFNIHRFESGLESISNMFRQQDADLICLQEAHYADFAQVKEDPVELLAQRLNGLSHVSRSTLGIPADQACDEAILCRWPIRSAKAHALDKGGWVFAMEAVLDIEGRAIRVFSVHLHATWKIFDPRHVKESNATRRKQVEALLALVRDSRENVIIAGDFNATPDSQDYALFTSVFSDFAIENQRNAATIPATFPLLRIDYIMGKGDFVTRTYSVLNCILSDHRPVVAELEFHRD